MSEQRAALDTAARDNSRRLQQCAAAPDDAKSLPYLVLRISNGNTATGNTVHAARADWPEIADARRIDNDQLHALDPRSWHELGYAVEALTQRELIDGLTDGRPAMLPTDAARLANDAKRCETPMCGCRFQVFARRGGSFAALFNHELQPQLCHAPRAQLAAPRAQSMHRTASERETDDEESMCVIV